MESGRRTTSSRVFTKDFSFSFLNIASDLLPGHRPPADKLSTIVIGVIPTQDHQLSAYALLPGSLQCLSRIAKYVVASVVWPLELARAALESYSVYLLRIRCDLLVARNLSFSIIYYMIITSFYYG